MFVIMQNNKMAVAAIAALVVGGAGGFFGGVKYEQAKAQNQRGVFMQRFSGGQGGGNMMFSGGMRRVQSGGFVTGQVLSKDDKSVTIKSMDGGSKIVYYGQSTQISKPAPVQASDLNVGDNVLVAGSAGTDGSITAQTIQIRPPMPTPTPSK